MTSPAVALLVISLYPSPGVPGIGSPYWTLCCVLTGAMAGIAWLSYDFRRLRQRQHLEAF